MHSAFVGIPLTLLQCITQTLHCHTFTGVQPVEVGINFALASAVYSKDRFVLDEDERDDMEPTTKNAEQVASFGSMLGVMTYYASDPYTLALAPMVPALYYEYARQKPAFAPYKPLVVGACWTLATYAQPLLIRHDLSGGLGQPLSLLLLFAAISHHEDIDDIDEDAAAGIVTPAVRLGREVAPVLTYALLASSVIVHHVGGTNDAYDFHPRL